MANIDERYKRGKIYAIRCRYDDTLIYVGSTIDKLAKRMAKHRADNKCSLYNFVNGDWGNWYIELYEDFPCDNKEQLVKREGGVIREIATINRNIAGRTMKEYVEENKKFISDINKKYYEDNRDEVRERKRLYHINNREVILQKQKTKGICDICGAEICIKWLKKHQRTLKCLNAKKNNTE